MQIYRDDKANWDCVSSCFFIDTANNVRCSHMAMHLIAAPWLQQILQYIDQIARMLKVGGVWINFGPPLAFIPPCCIQSLARPAAVPFL